MHRVINPTQTEGGRLPMSKLTGLGVTALLSLSNLAYAAPAWEIDTTHSTVTFTVRHFFTNVTGNFNEITGAIHYDPADPAATTAEITIPVASVDTRNQKRDSHLQSPDFFDGANHPNLTFKSTKVTTEGDKLKVAGDLTMRGVTKPVVFDVEVLGVGPDPRVGQRAGFVARATVNRLDWNIAWNNKLDNGSFVLGDDVKIEINIGAIQKSEQKS
jgi:polyisoprenoid-binding protein YceI